MTTPHESAEPGTPMRVLLVDDHIDSVISMGRLLRTLGYEVRAALDGARALEAAHDFRPDAAIIDLSLPELDGYTVARRMRADTNTRETRLIAMTGWSTKESHFRSREAGFELHLVKPVSVASLTDALSGAPC